MAEFVSPRRQMRAGNAHAPRTPPLPGGSACLFLDVDGTLLDFARTPDQVRVDRGLIELLEAAHARLQGAIALVSGRPIGDLDRLFDPLRLPAAGIHGSERRNALGIYRASGPSATMLESARKSLEAFAGGHPGILMEDKGCALAVHFRSAPHQGATVRRLLQELAHALKPDFELLEGNCVMEIKPSAKSKGTSIEAFLREAPFAGRQPVFIGDDFTDLEGLAAVERHGGIAVAVGDRIPAPWRLSDPAAVLAWLRSFVGEGAA